MRSTRNQPFCWQEKKILRLFRKSFKGNTLVKYIALYTALTEIDSDFNGKSIMYYAQTISTYSGLPKEWITSVGLKTLIKMKIIKLEERERDGGKFTKKFLIFTPECVPEDIPTVMAKTVHGETVAGKTGTLEDSIYKKIIIKEEYNNNMSSEKTFSQEEKLGKMIEIISKTKESVGNEDEIFNNLLTGAMISNPLYPAWFEVFWLLYPKNNGSKMGAFKTIERSLEIKRNIAQSIPLFLKAVYLYRKAREFENPKYTPHAQTWLNNRGWDDAIEKEFKKQQEPRGFKVVGE